uniref:Divalent-cation tolerance protein CutA n=1 Tax=Globodera rostochiensis TaxID=31243 RepID=A0A914H1B3_GLORO
MLIKVVYVTVPSMEIGKRIAHELVRSRLAACVNIVPQLTSIYEWKGKERLEQLRELVMKLHPYEVPEFVALPVEYGSEPYLRWVSDQISGGERLIPEVEEAKKQKKNGKKEDE